MQNNTQKPKHWKLSLAILSSILATGAMADPQNEHFANGLYIAPGLNYIDTHNIWDRNHTVVLDSTIGANLAVGYQFDNPWALELHHQYAKPDMETANQKIRINYTHIDGLYTLDTLGSSALAPYLVTGAGVTNYKTSGFDKTDTTLNAGAGVKYAFNPKLHLRFDTRYTLGLAHIDSGLNTNLNLVFAFGNTSKKTTAQPVKEEVVKIIDTDGDGVPDNIDQCPDTLAGAKVDANGCYVYTTETHEFTLNVVFNTASAEIDRSAKDDVRKLAIFLKQYQDTKVTIEGHSDNTGLENFNKGLSQQRAEAVKQSLVNDYGIDSGRLAAVGYGASKPVADNATEEGRAQNRRVVAKVEAQEQVIQQVDAE